MSILKSVPNLISYLHEFFQNVSQSIAIFFELFSFGEFVYSEIADSGPHLSANARRAGPAWLPRVAPTSQLKAAVGTARRASRQLARPRRARPTAAPLSVPPPSRRAARVPIAACAPPSPRPSPRPRPDRLADRAAVPTGALPVDVAPSSVVPTPVSRCSSAASRAPAPCRRRLTEQRRRALRRCAPCAALADWAGPRALRRPRPSRAAPRVSVGRARGPRQRHARGPCPRGRGHAPRTVHLGRARFRPSSTRLNFIIF
jgi:hypothetical protein